MPLDELTITLSGPDGRVSVETLAKALKNALDMVQDVGSNFVAAGVQLRWEVVRVSMDSPLTMTMAPRTKGRTAKSAGRKTVKACLDGVARIEKEPNLPPHFNQDALEAVGKMVNAAKGDKTSIGFTGNGVSKKIVLTDNAVRHIEEVVAKARQYIDYGTIEGRLEAISIHKGHKVVIWETLTNNEIDCNIEESDLDEAMSLFGHRVAISGRIRYKNHKPISIAVEKMKKLRASNELPQLKDIPPLNITDGLSSEEYVRRMRNAQ